MTIPHMVREVQEALGIEADGVAGPVTWRAVHGRICGAPRAIQPVSAAVDQRSAKNIATLHPRVAFLAERLVRQATAQGIDVRVICGLRTIGEQEALYAQGRTKPGPIVTQARGGQSWHNFGAAFDVGVFHGSEYLGASPHYREVGKLGKPLGLEWGGDWKFLDEPHFQLRPNWALNKSSPDVLAEFARRIRAGRDIWG
jgi:peptidoglycan L-alanyl-D-glutamate endopeptidase CwlK